MRIAEVCRRRRSGGFEKGQIAPRQYSAPVFTPHIKPISPVEAISSTVTAFHTTIAAPTVNVHPKPATAEKTGKVCDQKVAERHTGSRPVFLGKNPKLVRVAQLYLSSLKTVSLAKFEQDSKMEIVEGDYIAEEDCRKTTSEPDLTGIDVLGEDVKEKDAVQIVEGAKVIATESVASPKEPVAEATKPKVKETPAHPPVHKPVPQEETLRVLPHSPELVVTELAAQVVAEDKKGKIQRIKPSSTLKLTADGSSVLKLRFSSGDASLPDKPLLNVHQAFVVFKDAKGQENEVVIAASRGDSEGKYVLDLDFSSDKVRQQFHHLSSTYSFSILLGSFTARKGYSWTAGSIDLTLPEGGNSKPKVQPGQPDPEDYMIKPEIQHVFRQPEKVPPVIVSVLAMLAVVIVPWAFLLWAWTSLPISFNVPPALAFPTHAFFVGTLGLFYVLLWAYWTVLNLFQLLAYLAVLGPVTAVAGRLALAEIAGRRQAKVGKEKKKA
ncbi:hypothetical protein HDU93_003697 [Gonapodya sp. JEL0774]|nr:hypothetical protein HDU93_003697 [Gonapodya sp. JEL0774]